jgi:hypothetical protein
MMVLGIVLIVLAVVFGLGVSVSSGASTTMSVFGVDFGVAVPTVVFLGAAAGAALVVGLWLAKKGLGRGYRRHKEVRELRQQVAAQPETTEPSTAEPSTAVEPSATGKHAAHLDDPDAGTVDAGSDERLATERRTVADGTDTKQPH